MLVIRFFRVGKKNQPSFKIVVTPKRNPPRGGRFIEEVGFYNPLTKEKVLKEDRIKYWISSGAKTSATVHNLLVKEKIIEGKKIPLHKKLKKKKEEAVEKAPEATPTKEGAKKEETKATEKGQKEEVKAPEVSKKEEKKGEEKKPEKDEKA